MEHTPCNIAPGRPAAACLGIPPEGRDPSQWIALAGRSEEGLDPCRQRPGKGPAKDWFLTSCQGHLPATAVRIGALWAWP